MKKKGTAPMLGIHNGRSRTHDARIALSHNYITDVQWQLIEPLLPRASARGRPRTVCRRAVINAILYITRTGCQWRMLPSNCPKWRTVYTIFRRWLKLGVWERINDRLRTRVRKQNCRKPVPTAAIIDSQTVKTTEVGGVRGLDGHKRICGRKRHIIVDTLGLLLAVVVHSADQQDQSGACLVLCALWQKMKGLRVIYADSAYGRQGLPEFVRQTLRWLIQIVSRPRAIRGRFAVQPKRWIVERTFGWLGGSRRLSKDYERNTNVSESFIQIRMIQIMLNRLHPVKLDFENTLLVCIALFGNFVSE